MFCHIQRYSRQKFKREPLLLSCQNQGTPCPGTSDSFLLDIQMLSKNGFDRHNYVLGFSPGFLMLFFIFEI